MTQKTDNRCPLKNEDACFKNEIDCTCETCPVNGSITTIKRKDIRDMLTIKDKTEQFKRDCKSNDYYTKAILDCNERIEELDVILNAIGSPNGNTDPKCENRKDPYRDNKIKYIMKQDAIIKERDDYIKKINSVNSILMKITDPVDRQMIVSLYIDRKPCKVIADYYHFNDHSAMLKRVKAVLKSIFNKLDTM